jgi:hypothetical protein
VTGIIIEHRKSKSEATHIDLHEALVVGGVARLVVDVVLEESFVVAPPGDAVELIALRVDPAFKGGTFARPHVRRHPQVRYFDAQAEKFFCWMHIVFIQFKIQFIPQVVLTICFI